AVRQVLQGGLYLSDDLDRPAHTGGISSGTGKPSLTQRQELVLYELLNGRSNRAIGQTMHISEETVKTHVAAILRHFDVQNRTQAVVAAARDGYRPK
ncbi:MAG: response regulator transcription factor, partial [Rhodoferax sp.]